MSIGWIVMACVFGGTLLGMALRLILPEHHLSVILELDRPFGGLNQISSAPLRNAIANLGK
jgi:hypothetical protein